MMKSGGKSLQRAALQASALCQDDLNRKRSAFQFRPFLLVLTAQSRFTFHRGNLNNNKHIYSPAARTTLFSGSKQAEHFLDFNADSEAFVGSVQVRDTLECG